MPDYYVIGPEGEKFGPASAKVLNEWANQNRVNSFTMVEEQGTGRQMRITGVPGFIAPPAHAPPPMGYGQAYNRPYIPVENHLVKAILSTFFCCLPLGIVAIVYASQVDGHARRGDHQMALDTARKADIWANWSIGLVVVYIFGYLLLVGLAASSGHSTYR